MVAIAGMPPLGIFMSEFLVVSSTFARQPLLALPLVAGLLVGFGALLLRLHGLAFGTPRGGSAPVKASCRRCSPIWRWCCSRVSIFRRRWSPGSRTSPRSWAEDDAGNAALSGLLAYGERSPRIGPGRAAACPRRAGKLRSSIWRPAI